MLAVGFIAVLAAVGLQEAGHGGWSLIPFVIALFCLANADDE